MSWYAVRVGPSMEKRVATALTDHGVETYYPVEKVWRSKRCKGRRMTAERPKARGYVFAQWEYAADLVALAHEIDGVLEVLGFSKPDATVDAWIARVKAMEAAGDFDETLPRDRRGRIKHKLEVGDRVTVNGGLILRRQRDSGEVSGTPEGCHRGGLATSGGRHRSRPRAFGGGVTDARKPMAKIPAGALLNVTTGEYSDYHVRGTFRALSDMQPDALIAEYLASHPEQAKPYSFEDDAFIGWLAAKGLVEDVPTYEWHLGDYSTVASGYVEEP